MLVIDIATTKPCLSRELENFQGHFRLIYKFWNLGIETTEETPTKGLLKFWRNGSNKEL